MKRFDSNETDVVIDGARFEALQGTGKVEMSNTSDYTGTIVAQTVNSWSDTQINVDLDQGAIPDGIAYLYVTNDSGDRTAAYQITIGFALYDPAVSTGADHWWTFNNTLDDSVGSNPAGVVIRGTPVLVATPICRSMTHSYEFDDGTTDRRWLTRSSPT